MFKSGVPSFEVLEFAMLPLWWEASSGALWMMGGIVRRLVVSEVSFPEALHGPTTATTIHGRGLFVPSPKSDYNYCDDTLSESEAEAISGRIYCYTGMRLWIIREVGLLTKHFEFTNS